MEEESPIQTIGLSDRFRFLNDNAIRDRFEGRLRCGTRGLLLEPVHDRDDHDSLLFVLVLVVHSSKSIEKVKMEKFKLKNLVWLG